jgi:hypothetical protein
MMKSGAERMSDSNTGKSSVLSVLPCFHLNINDFSLQILKGWYRFLRARVQKALDRTNENKGRSRTALHYVCMAMYLNGPYLYVRCCCLQQFSMLFLYHFVLHPELLLHKLRS